jgi:hypothetical protein
MREESKRFAHSPSAVSTISRAFRSAAAPHIEGAAGAHANHRDRQATRAKDALFHGAPLHATAMPADLQCTAYSSYPDT